VNARRAYLSLQRQFDEDHPALSAAGPWFCFVLLITFALLFRLSTIVHGTVARCVENDEFWYTPANGSWPLFASLFFVFFLLFVWNALLAVDGWRRSAGNKALLVVNAVGILSMLYVFLPLHDRAYHEYHAREGYYEDIHFRLPRWYPVSASGENPCITMERFAGRWQVVDRKLGTRGLDIPYAWIDLKPWGRFTTEKQLRIGEYEGWWSPPYRPRYRHNERWLDGRITVDGPNGWWDFDVRHDTLTLTTSEYFAEQERSTIVFQRIEPD